MNDISPKIQSAVDDGDGRGVALDVRTPADVALLQRHFPERVVLVPADGVLVVDYPMFTDEEYEELFGEDADPGHRGVDRALDESARRIGPIVTSWETEGRLVRCERNLRFNRNEVYVISRDGNLAASFVSEHPTRTPTRHRYLDFEYTPGGRSPYSTGGSGVCLVPLPDRWAVVSTPKILARLR